MDMIILFTVVSTKKTKNEHKSGYFWKFVLNLFEIFFVKGLQIALEWQTHSK